MPPYLAPPYFDLSRLPVTTKVVLTGFSLSVLSGILFTAFAVFAERTGWETDRVKANFAGDERVTREEGTKFDQMYGEPSRRAIYDIIHPHSFLMPVLYFILCHMMEMTGGARAFKLTVYIAAFVSMMLVIFAPLLVWTSLSTAWLVVPSVTVLCASFIAMAAWPLYPMWFGSGRKPA